MKKRICCLMLCIIMLSAHVVHGYSTAYPNTHVNTGNQATDIVAIAKTQIGYKETSSDHTKYNAWYFGYDASVAWCAVFISWCANQAGIPTSIIARTSSASNNSFGTPTYTLSNHSPQPGDIIYIDNDAKNGSASDHVGLIVNVDSSYIYAIEGNYSQSVKQVRYNRSTGICTEYSAKIVLFGSPNYNGSSSGGGPSTPATLKISNPEQTISKGQSGSAVIELQQCLNKLMNAGLAVDGQFGDNTFQAVKNFQAKYGLTVDGIAGPNTNNKINSLLTHTHSFGINHEAAHPHREYKKCSCGHTEYTGKTVTVSTCSQCTTPGKPKFVNMKNTYNIDEEVIIDWTATENTTHYNLYIEKKNSSGNYVYYDNIFYATARTPYDFDPGEYQMFVQSTNSNAWTDDGSTWKFTNSDMYYLTVVDEYIPTSTVEWNGHTYSLYDYSVGWGKAKKLCEEFGGHLATINSDEECEFMFSFIEKGGNTRYYLGGTDINDEGNWEWVTGEQWIIDDHWRDGEPNNDRSQEHYLEIRVDGWNDVTESFEYSHGFIFERDTIETPTPTPVSYLTYTITDNKVTIIKCDNSVTGDFSIPATIEGYPVTTIGDDAFRGCENLTSITIPDSITTIGDRAFEFCDKLTSIIIPDNVTSIGEFAFYECTNLTSVTISNSITTITEEMFGYCENLTSVTIPNGVTAIDNWAFVGCSNLTSVVIPDSITTICYGAFLHCENLKDVYYTGTQTKWTGISIDSYNENLTNATIHYNYGTSSAVSGDTNGDGEVNAGDVTVLMQIVAGWGSGSQSEVCDVNGDGKVDAMDITRLMQLVAGWA